MKKYYIQKSPFVVPTLDGKLIEEHFGLATDANSKLQYSNPFDQECEYLSICLPAFSVDSVHRDE